MVLTSATILLPWPYTKGVMMEVGTQAFRVVHVLTQVAYTPIEVPGYAPLNLGCTLTVRPVVLDALGSAYV